MQTSTRALSAALLAAIAAIACVILSTRSCGPDTSRDPQLSAAVDVGAASARPAPGSQVDTPQPAADRPSGTELPGSAAAPAGAFEAGVPDYASDEEYRARVAAGRRLFGDQGPVPCHTACDCPAGLVCQPGSQYCTPGLPPVPCCDRSDCPQGQPCQTAAGGNGVCGEPP